ncbi:MULTISPECIES: IclR family transcriptional regulator [unclassified Aeromicrobium]|uniref:IclR family transcriptional regulator n=1 Tax=unclassified Aeromicrobium TaxID=2633570 RepID=UPI00396B330C
MRAFRIFEAFRAPGESLTLSALATRAGVPKSSALRIASQLVDLGALERREDGRFVVGLRMLELATMAPRGHGLRSAALPYMEDLHRVTDQHVQLAVREGSEAVLVERLSARGAIAVAHRVGGRLPLDETGVGLALLASAPDAILRQVLGGPATDARLAAHQRRVRQLLAVARRDGVVALTAANPVGVGPREVTTVAAAILDGRGTAVGALSVVQPGGRAGVNALKVALRTASLGISRVLEAAG